MPVVTKLSYRKPTRVVQDEKEKDPKPISQVGGGRSSSMQAFTQGMIKQ